MIAPAYAAGAIEFVENRVIARNPKGDVAISLRSFEIPHKKEEIPTPSCGWLGMTSQFRDYFDTLTGLPKQACYLSY